MLEREKARKQFGGVIAVNDVSFDVRAGEIVALIGPNGAGKSTTFNLITGVLPLTSGDDRVPRRVDRRRSPPQEVVRLGIARTFQHVKLVPDMTRAGERRDRRASARHAPAISSMLRLDRAEEARLLAEAARARSSASGSADQSDQLAGSLSLGQQRIVEIARALASTRCCCCSTSRPPDCATWRSSGSPTLLRSAARGGMSVLLVEHDMEFVMELADRLVVLDFGTRSPRARRRRSRPIPR